MARLWKIVTLPFKPAWKGMKLTHAFFTHDEICKEQAPALEIPPEPAPDPTDLLRALTARLCQRFMKDAKRSRVRVSPFRDPPVTPDDANILEELERVTELTEKQDRP